LLLLFVVLGKQRECLLLARLLLLQHSDLLLLCLEQLLSLLVLLSHHCDLLRGVVVHLDLWLVRSRRCSLLLTLLLLLVLMHELLLHELLQLDALTRGTLLGLVLLVLKVVLLGLWHAGMHHCRLICSLGWEHCHHLPSCIQCNQLTLHVGNNLPRARLLLRWRLLVHQLHLLLLRRCQPATPQACWVTRWLHKQCCMVTSAWV
jgi:hypothetical protein